MKKRLLFLLNTLIISSLFSCGESVQSNTVSITFNALNSKENITLDLKKGDNIANFLNGDLTILNELTISSDYSFDAWYVTEKSAKTLDSGENSSNIFSLYDPCNENKEVYAGYILPLESEIKENLNYYLGTFSEDYGYSLPLLKGSEYEIDETRKNGYYIKDITLNRINSFKDELVSSYGFSKLDDTSYLSNDSMYTITLTYDSLEGSVFYEVNFFALENEFPSYFFASSFLGYDYTYSINEKSFNLSNNEKDEKDKYVTYFGDYESYYENIKVLGYTPKDDDSSPLESLNTYLTSNGFTLASSSSYIYVDQFYTNYLLTSQLSSSSSLYSYLSSYGFKEGMIIMFSIPQYGKNVDNDTFLSNYNSISGTTLESNPYPYFYASSYGLGLKYTISSSSSTYGLGFYAFGFTSEYFDSYIKSLYNSNWTYSYTSSGDYYYKFQFLSKSGEYGLNIYYYDGSYYSDLTSNLCLLVYYHKDSVFDKATKWFKNQNVGGGSITSIPKFEASSYSSGYLTSNSSSVPYTYYVRGKEVEESEYNTFLSNLDEEWTKDQSSSTSEYLVYKSNDSFYTMYVIYSDSTLVIQLYYNGSRYDLLTTSDIYSYLDKRFESLSISVPGLDTLLDGEKALITPKLIGVNQYFDGTYNRALIVLSLSSSDDLDLAYNTINNSIEDETNGYTYVGENSSGITFYKDSNNTYLYFYKYSDSSSYYYLYIGLYRSPLS